MRIFRNITKKILNRYQQIIFYGQSFSAVHLTQLIKPINTTGNSNTTGSVLCCVILRFCEGGTFRCWAGDGEGGKEGGAARESKFNLPQRDSA